MPRARDHSDTDARALWQLIHDYKVFFGSASEHRHKTWLDPYRLLLNQIGEIKAIRFEDYPPANHHDPEAASMRKLLVRRIQFKALRCRLEGDNEAGWINNVASLVFEQLDQFEFVW
jgi:hypothetical protein